MRILTGCLALSLFSASLSAQPAMTEPSDFPAAIPGPSAVHSGVSCYWAASGTIEPGDVDWLQVWLPFDSARTVVDVDFGEGASRGLLLTAIAGGGTGFGMGDGNNESDGICGSGFFTEPPGNTSDNALDLGATAAGTTINIGISGFADFGFNGDHKQTYEYDVWVHAEADQSGCSTDAECDDGVACTVDRCDEFAAVCMHPTDDTLCDDGLFCTGDEFCDELTGCQSGTPPDCDDAIDCTVDSCDEAAMACANSPDDAECDNGQFCDGAEECDPLTGCASSTPVDCDDGFDCTADTCDDTAGACQHTTDDNLCDNGSFCDGVEVCDADQGCQPGDQPCAAGQVCDEAGACSDVDGPQLDIRPEHCPNKFNPRSGGRIRIALVGTTTFDVSEVNLDTLELSRADGERESTRPLQGRRRQRIRVKDVTGPSDTEGCDCIRTHKDGVDDLVMKFSMRSMIRDMELRGMPRREMVELVLTGELLDGTPFAASDCIRIDGRRSRRRGHDDRGRNEDNHGKKDHDEDDDKDDDDDKDEDDDHDSD